MNFSSLNQSFIEKNIRIGNIKVNEKKTKSKHKLQIEDSIIIYNFSDEIYFHFIDKSSVKKIPSKYNELFKLNILYQNDDFIILNKWTGIATQGGSKINISIDDIIKNISNDYNLVHRLDRETSGLLIIAKDLQTTKYFGKLFKEQMISKIYIATCQGIPKNNESIINLSIKDKKDPTKSSISITGYKVFQSKNNLSNIIFFPKTGKTHQIRIVAKHLGCPIVGDTKYNIQNKYNFEKLKLHAFSIRFLFNDDLFEFTCELHEHAISFYKKNNLNILDSKNIKKFL